MVRGRRQRRLRFVRGGAAVAACLSVDVPVLLSDNERRMKRELLAWAKAVVNMAISQSMQC